MQTQGNNNKRKLTKRTRLSLGVQLAVLALIADAATLGTVHANPAVSATHAASQGALHTFNIPSLALDE
ncbi:MAG: hypothetical protein RSE94_21060, partial [Pseudomonas sp.]